MLNKYVTVATMNNQFISRSLYFLLKTTLFILLVAATSLFFVSYTVRAQNSSDIQGIEQFVDLKEDQNMYLVIRSSLQKSSLEKIANDFREKGVTITFSSIQYNSNDLLTRIVMHVTIGDCNTVSGGCYRWQEEAYNDGSPINSDKPLVFYLYRKGQSVEAASTSYGYPQDLPPQEIKAMKNMTGSIIGIFSAD